jgi:hypothetical protein
MKGIVLPIILGLVATAASFYSAYNKVGDNDTAHTLAYGVWYSWSIIAAVVSNCYVATTNPGVARLALNYEFLSEITVPLRERSENTQKWREWLQDIGCGEQGSPAKDPAFQGNASFWSKSWSLLRLLIEQTLAWVCIGMPCACAASISYTTPTVGLGCRSFTFLLYGICTLMALSVPRPGAENSRNLVPTRLLAIVIHIWYLRECLHNLDGHSRRLDRALSDMCL